MGASIAISAALGLGLTVLLIPVILRFCGRKSPLPRSTDLHHTHKTSIPRLGGLALAGSFVGVELFIALFFPEYRQRMPGRNVIDAGCLMMFLLGFWDDCRALGARRKLLGQILIAAFVWCNGLGIQVVRLPFGGFELYLSGWGALVTILWLVGMTNLVNLIDGVDGLAGGICLMLMMLLGYVGQQSGHSELLIAGMAGALLGFLWFNFPPARIYMGDGGAYFLGFQIGLLSLVNSQKGTVFAALAAPLFVLALPILDTTLAILRRGLSGLPIFRPDRKHLHHRLLSLGFSRRRVVLSFYAVTLICLVIGMTTFWSRGEFVPVLMGLTLLLLLLCASHFNFSQEWFSIGRVVGNSLAMRQHVHYALSLIRWLELEGVRQRSLADFWSDFTFAARKLGFVSARVTLKDGQLVWSAPDSSRATRWVRYDLQNRRRGILELEITFCPHAQACARGTLTVNGACAGRAGACVSNPKNSEIVAELLAEAWMKSSSKFLDRHATIHRFGRPEVNMAAAHWVTAHKAEGRTFGPTQTS